MKGIGPLFVALMALILLVVIVTGSSIYLAAKSETVIRTTQETATINNINYMELLKDSLRQSLVYSSYQAFYTIAQNGGYQKVSDAPKSYNNIPYWRIYDDITGYPTMWGPITSSPYQGPCINNNQCHYGFACVNFVCVTSGGASNLEKLILGYLNQYVNALTVKGVTIPNYQLHLICDSQTCTAQASSQDKLQFVGVVILSDIATVTTSIKTQVQALFDNGKANYVDKDSIQNAIVAAKNSLPNACVTQTTSYCETQTAPTCESLYPTSCLTTFKDSIHQNLLSLQSPGNLPSSPLSMEIRVDVTNPDDIKVAHTSIGPTELSRNQDASCGCAQTSQVCDSNNVCSTVCVRYYQLKTISCTYNNYGASKVLVTYTDTKNKYPVYDINDKTTDMRFTKLNFYVISGSDYSDQTQKLIKP